MEHEFRKSYSGPGDLLPSEIFWRENYCFLAASGYQLRPRYNPDWIPSWNGTNEWWFSFEDGQIPSWTTVMDARRLSDNALVILKKTNLSRSTPRAIEIARRLSAMPSAADSENHCAPLYEVLEVPDSTDLAILVMPYFFQTGGFETLGEVVEYFRQVFEGLYFLHRHGIAHRSVKPSHVLMDAAHLYPEPFHPVFPTFTYDLTRDCNPCSRTEKPVRYYLVDFSRAVSYPPTETSPQDYPYWDGDYTVPEYWLGGTSDPFAGDVYCLGNMMSKLLRGADGHSELLGFGFMESLIRDMTHSQPSCRPTIQEAVLRFTAITATLSTVTCRSRLATRDENYLVGLFRSTLHWMRQLRMIWNSVPPIPKTR